ncbi:tRNA pseudouridine(38-40) synthase TruA [Microlunatus soli]|uniref:tRNA pseudouridine synthase A n=1 Tax=Microlunatus soli TaxID=630515 RepID=A0A1H1WSQ0_9ACTN|nr:tRNA pseudouridine(38-40) synthase TruA [Microlunatus soli]SDT00065.1 tRNA pseudouridine38-40 synthase [Microlunatus soli]
MTSGTTTDPIRWRLDVSYRGTDFSGWAAQPGLRTVQGELELWLPRLLRTDSPVALTCAGRTDAGVHARGQVCHLDLAPGLITDDGSRLLRRLARVLPDDLVVRRVGRAPAGFDARFSASWRRYCYRIGDGVVPPDPLLRDQIARWPRELDLAAMNEAARQLLGLRDFAAFCKRRDGASTIRTLLKLAGTRVDHGPQAGTIEFTVVADAFCHSMVRSLIGALVRVGEGARSTPWIAEIQSAAVRDSSVPVMAAAGLTLEEVGYPPDEELAERATRSRNRRSSADLAAPGPDPDPEQAS